MTRNSSPRPVTRRTFTALTASTFTLTAGCTTKALNSGQNDGSQEQEESSISLPYRSDTPEENVDSPRSIRLSNSDNTQHTVALEIEASSNAFFDETYKLSADDAKFVENVASMKTTYHVSVRVDNRDPETYTWNISESVKDLIVEIEADGQLSLGATTTTGESSGGTTAAAGNSGA